MKGWMRGTAWLCGILLVVGLVLLVLGSIGRPVAGRKVWF
mgnify:CR=1 FL=1